jgi:hypothetical protein
MGRGGCRFLLAGEGFPPNVLETVPRAKLQVPGPLEGTAIPVYLGKLQGNVRFKGITFPFERLWAQIAAMLTESEDKDNSTGPLLR